MAISQPADLLELRAAEYRVELRRIQTVLASVTETTGSGLDSPVRDRFNLLFRAAREDLANAAPQGQVTGDHWRRLEEARKTVQLLGREVLAYVEGHLLAEKQLDGGAAAAAARLVASLTYRTGIDRPALLGIGDAEYIDHTASVVRFRPLGTTAWQLPVIAHELGHHVAARLEDAEAARVYPVQTWVAMQSQAESTDTGTDFKRAGAWLHELFADVFATYALGAAYPLTVMAIRVEYDRIGTESDTHPPWSLRMAMMAAALESMSQLDVDQLSADTYLDLSQWLARSWANLAGAQPGPAEPGYRVSDRAAEIVGILAKHAQPRLRYDVTGPVKRLQEDLEEPDVPPPAGATPAHVLNAAWSWRLQHAEADDTVSARALARCAQAAL